MDIHRVDAQGKLLLVISSKHVAHMLAPAGATAAVSADTFGYCILMST
jgi:hypothetical protein